MIKYQYYERTILRKNLFFILLLMIFISLGLPDSLLSTTWPEIAISLDLNVTFLSISSIINLFFSMISANLYPYFIQKIQTKTIIISSLVICIIPLLIFSIFPSIIILLLSQILVGISAGAIDTAVNDLASSRLDESKLNFLHGFWGIGISFTPFLIGLIYTLGYSFQMAYLIIAIIIFLIGLFTLRNSQRLNSDNTKNNPLLKTIPHKMSAKDYLGPIIYFFYGVEFLFGLYLASYAFYILNFDSTQSSFIVFVYWGSLTLSRILSSLLFKLFDSKKIIKLYIICSFFASFFLFSTNYYLIVFICFIIGFAFGPIYPCFIAFTGKIYKNQIRTKIVSKQISTLFSSIFIMQIFTTLIFMNFSFKLFPIIIILLIGSLALIIFIYLKVHKEKL